MKTHSTTMIKGCLSILLSFCAAAQGGSLSSNWNTVAGGGCACNGGNRFSLTGTIGQASVATSSAANCSLASGFWAADALDQTPGGPHLGLTRAGSSIILSWPASWSGYVLQSSPNIGANAVWTTVAQPVVQIGSYNTVTLPANQPHLFFRLAKQ